jgi:hypothetical protein
MAPRYIVRRAIGENRYSVWDNEKDRPAVSEDRDCTDLGFADTFNIADDLNTADGEAKE